jgi:hypothetical protein
MYPARVSYGWEHFDSDPRNRSDNTPATTVPQPLVSTPAKPESDEASPESKPTAKAYGTTEDGYSEESKP